MKKLLTLACLLCMAASVNAQVVTFTNEGGENNDSWNAATQPSSLNTGTAWRANPGANTYAIFKASEETYIQGYRITVAYNGNDGVPYTWNVMGKKDNEEWELIHSQVQANNIKEDFGSAIEGKSYTFYCNTRKKYLYYKINITAKECGNYGCFRMYRFDLIPSSVGFSASGNGMDGDTGTKMEGSGGNTSHTITITGTAATRINGFQFTTANDNATQQGRNPQNIQVEGSNDSTSWTPIQSWENYTGLGDKNYYPYVFKFNSPQEYKYYRFTFSNISATWFQMSEIALITPLKISTPTHLVNFASLVNTGTTDAEAELTADIDASGIAYTPIGTSSNRYTGTFNGNGHYINLGINTSNGHQGLFGYANGGASFSNLIIKGSISGGANCAALLCEANGSGTININRVGCEVDITSTGNANAAFVGNDSGGSVQIIIQDSYNTGNISAATGENSAIGGWMRKNSQFTNVYNTGTVNTHDRFAYFYNGDGSPTFTNCYTTTSLAGNFSGPTTGIDASMISSGELCYKLNGSIDDGTTWTQTIGTDGYPVLFPASRTVHQYSAGIYTNLPVSGGKIQIANETDLNQFASEVNFGNTALNAELKDDIDYTAYPKGFIGTNSKRYSGTFEGNQHTVTTDIKNDAMWTGLFGTVNGATIRNLIIDGNVESSQKGIGGIGGLSYGSTTVKNVVVKSALKYTGTGDSTCGGLFGDMENAFTVENCAFLGSIDVGSGKNVGGLVSWTGSGTFYNCLVAPVSVTSGDTNEFSDKWGGDASSNNCYNVADNDARLASGELCYLLNGSTCYDVNWTQTLGTDSNPIPFNTHGIVNKISAARYTTQYIPTTDVTIPTGVEVFAGVKNGSNLTLVPINDAISKEDAVILRGNEGYYSFVPTTGVTKATSNSLSGSDGTATGGDGIYALSQKGEPAVVGFYPVGSGVTIPAGKAYLNLNGPTTVKAFTFVFDDDATGLDAVNGEGFMVNGPIYNLAGQRIQKMQKGINIVNGKKVMVK